MKNRITRAAQFLGSVMLLVIIAIPFGTNAAPPAGFQNQLLASTLSQPTDMAYLPDGRIFITQKPGTLVVYKNGALLPAPALSLPGLSSGGDRGLLSIALHPDFSENHHIYLAYTTSANHERISRFTVNGDVVDPNSELILIENPSTWSGFLDAVTVRYNPVDGKLYASFGSDGLTSSSQDLSSLDGKILRLNLDGSIPADNPFVNVSGAQGAIWSYGFRNPWKLAIDTDGTALIGDVGENLAEEIDRTVKGGNFGWPLAEGDTCLANCGSLISPLYSYPHDGEGAAVVGGDVYRGTAFPATFIGNYFFGDYVSGTLYRLAQIGAGTVVNTFDTGLGALSGIVSAPDGCLYYLVIFPGQLHRYCYGAVTPVLNANASAAPAHGALPLTVSFSADGSNDSSGAALSYAWDFGDGSTASGPAPAHTYVQKGVYTVTLVATNANGSATATAKVWAGYSPPVPVIAVPQGGTRYNDGDTVHFSGSAQSAADGTLAPSALSWSVVFHHNTHIHAPLTYPGVSSGSFTIPVADEPSPDTWYEIILTATDSVGLSSATARRIDPNIATLRVTSEPSGAQLLLDAQPIITPYTGTSVVGFHHTLSVNSPQSLAGAAHSFSSWSDGGAQTHTLVSAPGETTITANFVAGGGTVTQDISSSARTDADIYSPNQALFINALLVDTANLSNALVDLELWHDGVKIDQHYTLANFTAGQELSISWDTVAPGAGTYVVKIGVFAADWSELYDWNDAAAEFSVVGDAPPPLLLTATVSPGSTTTAPASSIVLTAHVSANRDIADLNLDLELYSSAGAKVAQLVTPVTLAAGVPQEVAWNLTVPDVAGTYTVKLGIFSADWNTLHRWENAASSIQVGQSAPQVIPAFVSSASMAGNAFPAGSTGTITTRVTATGDLSGVIIDTEIEDANDTQLAQRLVQTNLVANQAFVTAWSPALPSAPGLYTVKIGIFAAAWSRMYQWQNRAFQFWIGTPPGQPQPGVTYLVTVQHPLDGQSVAGTVEVRALVSDLDINSYDLWWETGGGELKNLDTDPVTRAYKHAWINFDAWNWMPDGAYPLTFVATDLAGNRIGSSSLTVLHGN